MAPRGVLLLALSAWPVAVGLTVDRDVPGAFDISAEDEDYEAAEDADSVHEYGKSSCQCLNWRASYEYGFLRVLGQPPVPGQPQAWFPSEGPLAAAMTRELTKFDDTACVNFVNETGSSVDAQWCLVDHRCDEGIPVPVQDCKLRICNANAGDRSLSSMRPEQVQELSARHGVDVAVMLKAAYPLKRGVSWKQAQQQEKLLQDIKQTGESVILDSEDGKLPFAVVSGESVFLVDSAAEADRDLARVGRGASTIRCYAGCATHEVDDKVSDGEVDDKLPEGEVDDTPSEAA